MIWDLFLSSFLLSVVLVGIHAYFGREIVRRGIIFTDIAVAQFSGVGIALSLVIFHGEYTYLFSLAFALLASLLIALSQRLKEYAEAFIGLLYALALSLVLFHGEYTYLFSLVFALLASLLIALSQRLKDYAEAFIGLLYALGLSLAVLILSFSAHGMEELKKLTASDILFVRIEEVFKTAIVYSAIGIMLYLQRYLGGLLRELSFFALFSLTLASSVRLAGVLVVFSLLVSPALVSLLMGRGLVFAWVWGTFWSFLAVVLSFWMDLPTGYTLVFFHSVAGLLVFLSKTLYFRA